VPDLCKSFRREAGHIWNSMHKAFLCGMSLSEETITEYALYNIALTHQGKDITVDIATKPAEGVHGGDWELWTVPGTKGIGFRVQAKRLFPNGRYQSLLKPGNNPYEQLDKLVAVSTQDNLIPLYCFYNFDHPPSKIDKLKNSCVHPYNRPTFWGCSVAIPELVKQIKSDDLSKLKSVMHPWHLLVCGQDLIAAVNRFLAISRRPGPSVTPRDLPVRITRLAELSQSRRTRDLQYLSDEYWSVTSEAPEELSGIVVFRDFR
jgi:hypothetical protein